MMRPLLRLAERINGLTLRERVIIFLMAALAIGVLVDKLVLEPLTREQARLASRMQNERTQTVRVRAEIQQKVNEHIVDPDAAARERLAALEAKLREMHQTVASMQKGLLSPDRIAPLLEEMLERSARLRLVALKKLPVTSLVTGPPPADLPGDAQVTGLYRHGVELTVQGTYLDMLAYLAELEKLSAQLFWGDVAFRVDEHPNATMTLTVYTLSLDKQWLHI